MSHQAAQQHGDHSPPGSGGFFPQLQHSRLIHSLLALWRGGGTGREGRCPPTSPAFSFCLGRQREENEAQGRVGSPVLRMSWCSVVVADSKVKCFGKGGWCDLFFIVNLNFIFSCILEWNWSCIQLGEFMAMRGLETWCYSHKSIWLVIILWLILRIWPQMEVIYGSLSDAESCIGSLSHEA